MAKIIYRMNKTLKYGILIFGISLLFGLSLKGNLVHEKFDSEKWKSWQETETTLSLRWDMMNSLRNEHNLKNKTKNEIIALLGNPENQSNSSFRYYLGISKRGINTGSLIIKFDNQHKVSDFYVWQG